MNRAGQFIILMVAVVSLFHAGQASAYMNSRMGRFMQRDPIEYVDGMSVYAYYAGLRGLADPLGLAAADKARVDNRIVDFYHIHSSYRYTVATGLDQLIINRLRIEALGWLDDNDVYVDDAYLSGISATAAYLPIWNDLVLRSRPLPPETIFHELIHVYGDVKGSPSKGVDEGRAWGSQRLARSLQALQGIEDLINTEAPGVWDYETMEGIWQSTWRSVQNILGTTYDGGTFSSATFGEIKGSLGFSGSCEKIASWYNQDLKETNQCIRFSCDDIGTTDGPIHEPFYWLVGLTVQLDPVFK